MKLALLIIALHLTCFGQQGYAVYSGVKSGQYTNRAFGKFLPIAFPIVRNVTNYAVFARVGTNGLESAYSSEVTTKQATNMAVMEWTPLIASNVVMRVLSASNAIGPWFDSGMGFTNAVTNGARFWMLEITKLN